MARLFVEASAGDIKVARILIRADQLRRIEALEQILVSHRRRQFLVAVWQNDSCTSGCITEKGSEKGSPIILTP